MKKKCLAIFISFFLILTGNIYGQSISPTSKDYSGDKTNFEKRIKALKQKRAELIGKPAPLPEIKDVQGKDLSWERYKGKYVLIDFWATYCAPCVAYIPEVKKAYQYIDKSQVEFVSICLDLEGKKLGHFAEKRQMNWPQFGTTGGWNSMVAEQFGITELPQYFLVNPQGTLLKFDWSDGVYNELFKLLHKASKKETISIGNELVLQPGDLLEATLSNDGGEICVNVIFTNEAIKKLEAWSEENFGKKAKVSAGGKTIFNGNIQMKLNIPSIRLYFPSKEEAEEFCNYMMQK